MSEEKHPVWQGLMDKSYDRWQNGDLKDKSKKDFLDALDSQQTQATLLGNLNYQVGNGGFSQWVGNGYALSFDHLWKVMELIPGDAANKVRGMLKEMEPFILKDKDWTKDRGFGWNYWREDESRDRYDSYDEDEEEEYEEETHEGYEMAKSLDDKYYAINRQFMDEIEAFLSGTIQPRDPKSEPVQLCKVRMALVGEDGNAFAILGRFQQAARRQGWPKEEIKKVVDVATAGDYDHLLCALMEHTVE